MPLIALLSLLIVLVPSINAGIVAHVDAPVYLLCANRDMVPWGVTYYLHPLLSMDSNNPPSIDYNASVSTFMYTVAGKMIDRPVFADNSRFNMPLMLTNENPHTKFYLVDIDNFHRDIYRQDRYPAGLHDRFTYDLNRDKYWRFGMDMAGHDADLEATMSLINDAATLDADWSFIRKWNTDRLNTLAARSITEDPVNNLLYMSADVNHIRNPASGLLMTYDISNKDLVNNVTCGAPMLLRYSPSRFRLFAITLGNNGRGPLVPQSLVLLNTRDCRATVLINNLPATTGARLFDAFNEATGDWHFAWGLDWDSRDNSMFYSLNVDTLQVTSTVNLVADTTQTMLLGITAYTAPSSNGRE